MIILDEQLSKAGAAPAIEPWYPGVVLSQSDVYAGAKDDHVIRLLANFPDSIFVTVNVKDFWRKFDAPRKVCVICLDVRSDIYHRVPHLLREVLKLPQFRTHQARRGWVIRVYSNQAGTFENVTVESYRRCSQPIEPPISFTTPRV